MTAQNNNSTEYDGVESKHLINDDSNIQHDVQKHSKKKKDKKNQNTSDLSDSEYSQDSDQDNELAKSLKKSRKNNGNNIIQAVNSNDSREVVFNSNPVEKGTPKSKNKQTSKVTNYNNTNFSSDDDDDNEDDDNDDYDDDDYDDDDDEKYNFKDDNDNDDDDDSEDSEDYDDENMQFQHALAEHISETLDNVLRDSNGNSISDVISASCSESSQLTNVAKTIAEELSQMNSTLNKLYMLQKKQMRSN